MLLGKISETLLGKRLDPFSGQTRRHIALIAFLAWVGLGADGLSSSCYGPEEASWRSAGIRTLGADNGHRHCLLSAQSRALREHQKENSHRRLGAELGPTIPAWHIRPSSMALRLPPSLWLARVEAAASMHCSGCAANFQGTSRTSFS